MKKKYGCEIIPDGLAGYPDLHEIRCIFNPAKKQLLLNGRLNERQLIFHLAKELGFQALALNARPLASSFTRVSSFESVLNNYKAAYFAVALLINKEAFIKDIGAFFCPRQMGQPGITRSDGKISGQSGSLFSAI